MTKQQLLEKVDKYKNEYDISNVISDSEKELLRYNLTLDNVFALIIYRKEDRKEITLMTKPSYNLNRIILNVHMYK